MTDAGRTCGPDAVRGRGRDRERERGAGTILVVATIAGIVAVLGMLLPLSVVLAAKQQAAGAADAAALAAADSAVGISPGPPCGRASSVAAANGASLAGCTVDGAIVTVAVTIPAAGFPVSATATAGPPPVVK